MRISTTELFYPLQGGDTPLHLATKGGHNTTCVEHLLSTPGIDVNIKNKVSLSIECCIYFLVRVHVGAWVRKVAGVREGEAVCL